MYRSLLNLILNIFLPAVLFSQVYNPLVRENCYWDVLAGNGQNLYTYDGGQRFFFDGDTIINSETYKMLKYHPFVQIDPAPSQFFVDTTTTLSLPYFFRDDSINRKVYILDFNSGPTEQLMYDFTLIPGDTLNSLYHDHQILTVNSVSNVSLLNGGTRVQLNLSNGFNYIEGIGGSQGFFYQLLMGLGWWYEENCVTENGVHIYGSQCFTILSSGKIIPEEILSVYPNPATDFLHIERQAESEEDFILYDINGRVVLEQKLFSENEKIDLSEIKPGIYFYKTGNSKSAKLAVY
jgi:hypothetical protein